MKKLIMFSMLIAIAVPIFSGIANAELVCLTICPTFAVPGDDITLTGYDENGDFFDLETLDTFESNFHGIGDPYYPLLKAGDELTNIEIVDGTIVFELTEDMVSGGVTMWDCFFLPGGDDVAFRIVGGDDGPFDTVAEAIAAGGTCEGKSCAQAAPAIVVDSNDLPVHEEQDAGGPPTSGPAEGQLLVSLAWQPGEGLAYPAFTATVTVDPNTGPGPHADFIFSDSVAADGSVTLSFSDANWSIPQLVAVDAVEDTDREGDESYPIELTVTINIDDPNFGNPTPVVVESSVSVADNDVPFVSVIPDEIELSESDPCTCVDLKIRLSHLPNDDVYVRVYSDGWAFEAGMASLDPALDPDGPDPNKLKFTPGTWDEEQTITVCPIDNDELAEPWTEYIDAGIFMPCYSEDVRYLVPWWHPDGSEVVQDPCTPGEDDSGGEADEAIVYISVQDNECGAQGFAPWDFNENCAVELGDFAHFYTQWLTCTQPHDSEHLYGPGVPSLPNECDKLWDLVGGEMGG